jgi:hypothetical protein
MGLPFEETLLILTNNGSGVKYIIPIRRALLPILAVCGKAALLALTVASLV